MECSQLIFRCTFSPQNGNTSLAVRLAESRSEAVQRLVLISGGAPIPLEYECSIFGINPACLSLLTPCIRLGFQRQRSPSSSPNPEGGHRSIAAFEDQKAAFQFNAYTLWATMAGQKWPEGDRHFYSRLRVPVLLICGSHDRLVSEAEEEETLFSLRCAQLRRLPKAGHMGMLEDPNRVNEFIEEHITNPPHPFGLSKRNQSCTPDSVPKTPITTQPNYDICLDDIMSTIEYSRKKSGSYGVDTGAESPGIISVNVGALHGVHEARFTKAQGDTNFSSESSGVSPCKKQVSIAYFLILADALRYCFEVRETGASESCRVCEKAFDEDLITINEKWNSDTKLGREYYYVEHFNRKIAELLQKREEYDKKEAQRMEILKAKLLSVEGCDKQMVTRENIDERLDEIMSSPPVQFNYSVSERGKTIHPESLGDLPS
ncbi:Abhydrolase domain-containing protein 8 [Echinococcus granulosus]|uniref:Abhydrolase domain-containing protein 8 n=1 Tax=Echinococcus granulosus TaxID=6210 RepID=W6UWW1_ECHGR|nr:Abhydrolase domain-containing protein 8 [Echinococcus granulosus]EUB62987.1 Abhydrolase domain-containing protein 8 [Echinococcus granulosus]